MRTTIAITACLLAMASNAFAHPPGFAHDLELFIGGATAESKYIEKVLGTGTSGDPSHPALCVADTFDIYYNDATGRNYKAYSCTLISSAPVPSQLFGKTVLIHYRLLSGSIIGVTALARQTMLDRMNTNNCTGAHSNATPQFICTTTVQAALDVGLSDEEPQLFIGDPNLPPGDTALSAAELGTLRITPLHAVMMGIVANTNLLNAMRNHQGLGATDRPNITSAQITSLLTRNNGVYNKSWAPLTGGNEKIVICRRIEGVGTQLAANQFWGGFPCSSTKLVPATAGNSVPGVYEVRENTLIPDMKKCLTDANNLNGELALGLLFLDNTPSDSADNQWDFLKIDGIEASLENTVSGAYPFYVEETMNVLKTTVATPLTLKARLINFLQAQFQDPVNFLLANPTTSFAGLPTATVSTASNVLKGTRFGNTCRASVLFNQ